MAYRADFYTPENIIGYTGELHNNPTVYFQSNNEFGHITQAYPDAWNIGREPVGDVHPGGGYEYVLDNNDRGVGWERWEHPTDGVIHIHTSRHPFISTQRANIDIFALLSQAIWRFSNQKQGEPVHARR